MIKLLSLSTALMLTLSVQPALAQGQGGDKPGKGRDGGGQQEQGSKDRPGRDHPGKGGGNDKAAGSGDRGQRPDQRVVRDDKPGRDRDGNGDRDRSDGPVIVSRERGQQAVVFVPYRDYGMMRGCPPGLAKKQNGCLPPGQAKKMHHRYDYRWGDPRVGYVHRYDDGYQYRYDRQGALLGYVPALGGALSAGRLWPTQYRYDPAPPNQIDYYRLSPAYDYRYADGAIYGVDRGTSTIQQVVALLTGQSATVGQRMPSGYEVYNVPYAYRNQYVDTPTAAYRYNDGAIYQVDPTTRLIAAVVPLLAKAL